MDHLDLWKYINKGIKNTVIHNSYVSAREWNLPMIATNTNKKHCLLKYDYMETDMRFVLKSSSEIGLKEDPNW